LRLVVDASTAVEYLLRTPIGTALAERLASADLAAPELIDVEVLAVLRRLVRSKRVDGPRAEKALEDLRDWDLERVAHRTLLADAWAVRENVSGYDAFYVALARRLGVSLLTADGPLSRAPLAGVVVENVRGGGR
jgi:predicted nucleic acid-binding protein